MDDIAGDVEKVRRTVSPIGLEHARILVDGGDGIRLEQLREAVDRYSARRTTVPGSYAHRHYIETGHALRLGCCASTQDAPPAAA